MKDDIELQVDDDLPDDDIDFPKRSRTRSNGKKFLGVLVGILVVVVLAAGIFYFITRRPSSDANLLQMKLAAFEEKISSLEKQITDLQGKSGTSGTDPALLQRLEELAHKVEALEKRAPSPTKMEAKPSPPKPAVTTEKQYHTVQKGETLYKISKTYGITVETLRKLNNLSPGQGPRTGQKLLVSSGK
jgi:LysM repeat protein